MQTLASFLPIPTIWRYQPDHQRRSSRSICCLESKAPNQGIRVENVSYWWRNGRMALDQVSLTVAPGELAMIVGANGSGKSTLLKVIRGLLKPTYGAIVLQRPCAYVHQSPEVQILHPTIGLDIGATIQRNLDLPQAEVRKRAIKALEMVGLVPVEDILDSAAHRLSGGQKQRAVVAAALAMNPTSFLFDEVTASMDRVNKAELLMRIRQIVTDENIAALWVTHLLEELDVADTIHVMSRGRIVASGPRVAMMPLIYDLQDGLMM